MKLGTFANLTSGPPGVKRIPLPAVETESLGVRQAQKRNIEAIINRQERFVCEAVEPEAVETEARDAWFLGIGVEDLAGVLVERWRDCEVVLQEDRLPVLSRQVPGGAKVPRNAKVVGMLDDELGPKSPFVTVRHHRAGSSFRARPLIEGDDQRDGSFRRVVSPVQRRQ